MRRRRDGRLRGAVLVPLCLLALAGACRWRQETPPPVVAPPPAPQATPLPAPTPPPPPGEREMSEAALYLGSGEVASAEEKLDAVIALGPESPSWGEAIRLRAILAARPDLPGRDLPLARDLLRRYLGAQPDAAGEAEARLILSLLDREEEAARAVADLRAQIESMRGAESELRSALAQREEELRKIKEILLGSTPGR